jgi:hypothetical protein
MEGEGWCCHLFSAHRSCDKTVTFAQLHEDLSIMKVSQSSEVSSRNYLNIHYFCVDPVRKCRPSICRM